MNKTILHPISEKSVKLRSCWCRMSKLVCKACLIRKSDGHQSLCTNEKGGQNVLKKL